MVNTKELIYTIIEYTLNILMLIPLIPAVLLLILVSIVGNWLDSEGEDY
jgi:hypothetical protein